MFEEDLVIRAKRPVYDEVVEIVMLEIAISIIQSTHLSKLAE
jgi:hypothetical protein